MRRTVLSAALLTAWSSCTPASAGSLKVPSEFPNIQAAIDAAAPGDTVLVAPGSYTGPGNVSLVLPGIDFVLRSEQGPEATIINAQSVQSEIGIAVFRGESRQMLIEGFSIVGATHGFGYGGGVYISRASPTVRDCVIAWNNASGVVVGEGGGVYCYDGSPLIVNCTISGNDAMNQGGGLFVIAAHPELVNTVLWGNCRNDAFIVDEANSGLTLTCCLYGSLNDLQHVIINQSYQADPMFCASGPCQWGPHEPSRLRVDASSPCLPANNTCGVLIGALGVGCPVEFAPESPSADGSLPQLDANVFPNPSHGQFNLRVEDQHLGPLRIDLLDAAGRVVCRRVEAGLRWGGVTLTWDTNEGECRIPSGVYQLRVLSPKGRAVKRVTIAR